MARRTQGGYSDNHWLWNRWRNMHKRCYRPDHKEYEHYGGRGIKVCERWRYFPNFIADIEPTYFDGATIDRIDVNGDYSPENCRWATIQEQLNNKRNNRHLTFEGKTMTVAQWARNLKMPAGRLQSRLSKGWSVEEALSGNRRLRERYIYFIPSRNRYRVCVTIGSERQHVGNFTQLTDAISARERAIYA